mgnify:CR=1 FL=1
MPIRTVRRIAALGLCAVALWLLPITARAQTPAPPAVGPLKVMTFNIRLGTAADGDNHWTRRREMLFDLLRREDADLVGLQEAFRFQIEEILAAVPGYAVAGVGRDDGKAGGETSAILFRASRFHIASSGTFWFSDTPDTPDMPDYPDTPEEEPGDEPVVLGETQVDAPVVASPTFTG